MRKRRSSAFTLIELLLAITIGLLVITLILSAYHTLVTALERRQDRSGGGDEAAWVLDQIAEDLTRMVRPDADEECPLLLESTADGQGGDLQLSFCSAAPNPEESELRWFDVVATTYTTRPGPDALELLRITHPRVGPESVTPPTTNLLHARVERVRVSFFHEEEWVDTWEADEAIDQPAPALPAAARIELALRDQGGQVIERSTEVFLPVGAVIEPTVPGE